MSRRDSLTRAQRRRLRELGQEADTSGWLSGPGANLRAPLSVAAAAGIARAGYGELRDPGAGRARMGHATSSSALVVNVFDYWVERERTGLAAALGTAAPIRSIQFEAPCPTGVPGRTLTLDVGLTLGDGRYLAVESKFGEWLERRSPSHRRLGNKYFECPVGSGAPRALWAEVGLQRCQRLAERLREGAETYRFFNGAQALKQALGLAQAWPARFELLYLYYDQPRSHRARRHAAEIESFQVAISEDFDFKIMTYQSLFELLRSSGADPAYLGYLQARYFPDEG